MALWPIATTLLPVTIVTSDLLAPPRNKDSLEVIHTVSDFSDKCTPARRLQAILSSVARTLRLSSPAAKRRADRNVLDAWHVYAHAVTGLP